MRLTGLCLTALFLIPSVTVAQPIKGKEPATAETPEVIRTEKPGRKAALVTTGGRTHSTFVFSPESNDPGWVFGVGMRMTIIPKRIAESETRFFPLLEAHVNKNFLKYLQWRNSLGVLYLQNFLSTGVYGIVRGRWLSVSMPL